MRRLERGELVGGEQKRSRCGERMALWRQVSHPNVKGRRHSHKGVCGIAGSSPRTTAGIY